MIQSILRNGLILGILFSLSWAAEAKQIQIEGVPFNCLDQVQRALVKDFKKTISTDKEEVAFFRSFINQLPIYSCLNRLNPNQEFFTWCDGSGCSGAMGTFSGRKCQVSELWSGQDDQDFIDPEEKTKNCLTKEDFKTN